MSLTFRSLIRYLGPRWLVKDAVQNADGTNTETDSRVLYAAMAVLDAATERVRLGVRARMPGLAPEDALAYIGRDLRILRGPAESTAAFEARLQSGLDDWWVAGGPWAMMRQLRGYCSPHAVRVRIYNNHGNCFTIDRDGTQSVVESTAWNWDGSTGGAKFSRFWVVIYPTTATPALPWNRTTQKWGDATRWQTGKWGGDSGTWGSTATREDVFAIRSIVRTWKPAGSRCESIIICFNDTALAPSNTAPPLPDGTWATGGKFDVALGRTIPSRHPDAIYWAGTS